MHFRYIVVLQLENMNKFQIDSNTKIASVHLKVSDINQSLQFYESFLGFKIVKKDSSSVFLSPDGKSPFLIALTEIETKTKNSNQKIVVKNISQLIMMQKSQKKVFNLVKNIQIL